MKKEELIKQNAVLAKENQDWSAADGKRREEFAKAFRWSNNDRSVFNHYENRNPSWPEIFVEVGKLLQLRDFRDFEGNLSNLGIQVDGLAREIKKEKKEL